MSERTMDDVKRRVRSLLCLAAAGSGATEAERETAQRLAQQLMAKHGLTEAEIPEREVARRQAPPPAPVFTGRVVFVFNGFGGNTSTTTGFSW